MSKQENFVGIDVGKEKLDIAINQDGEEWSVANNTEGIKALVKKLVAIQPALIVVEATGGLERLVVASLAVAGLVVARINPRRSHHFALADGREAKTDPLDARGLARFGQLLKPKPRPIKDEKSQYLADLLSRRAQVVKMKTAEKNRLQSASPLIKPRIETHLAQLQVELEDLETELQKQIDSDDTWQHTAAIAQSVPGIGPISAFALLAGLPELGHVNRKEIAALLGVAPFNRDSGKSSKRRFTTGGRGAVRKILHMATLAAIRFNPVIRDFYHRLLDAGKLKMVAITACMRKLIVILNSMVKNNTFWKHPTP